MDSDAQWVILSLPIIKMIDVDDLVVINCYSDTIDNDERTDVLLSLKLPAFKKGDNRMISMMSAKRSVLAGNSSIQIAFKDYMSEICESYGYSYDNAIEQFKRDIVRSDFTYCNLPMKSPEQILNTLNIDPYIEKKSVPLIITLLTQASLALPYQILCDLFTDRDDNELMCELEHKEAHIKYMLNTEKDYGTLVIEKRMRIINVADYDPIAIKKIQYTIEIPLDFNNEFINVSWYFY